MAGWTWYGVGGWLLASAGLVLMLTYLFGRRILVWRHPRCAACGYRLDGLPASVAPAQCPAFNAGTTRR